MTKKSGFIFTIDSAISITLLAVLTFFAIAVFANSNTPNIDDLITLQKMHDLMKIWLLENSPNEEMIEQAKTLFGENFVLRVNGHTIFEGNKTGALLSTKMVVLNKNLYEKEIEFAVYR
ncbi:MAG: hypothetical protein QXM75_01675 [Candidatus Diapherotrites archaeon]